MVKLNPEQEALLTKTRQADLAWRAAKATAFDRAMKAAEKETDALQAVRDLLAFQTAEAGVPITQVSARGLGTTATKTAYAAIEAGKHLAPKHDEDNTPKHVEFTRVDGRILRVTPAIEDIAPLLPLLDIELDVYQANEQLATADFELDAEGRLLSITEGFDPDFGRHPVVALVTSDAAYAARVREWAA